TPMAPAVALGADEVVPVLSTQAPELEARALGNLGDALEHVTDMLLENSYNVDRKLLLERNKRSAQSPKAYRSVELYRPIRPRGEIFNAGSYLYFERDVLERMYR